MIEIPALFHKKRFLLILSISLTLSGFFFYTLFSQMQLHRNTIEDQKEGNLQGKIEISKPTQPYQKAVETEEQSYTLSPFLLIIFIAMLAVLILTILFLFFKEQDKRIISQSGHAAMGEMIDMITHQWRQPLSTITMDVNNMLVDIELDNIDKETFKEYAHDIVEQTDHLGKTIDDFRNFFRQEKEKECVLPSNVVNECFKIMSNALKEHNITHKVICESEHAVQLYSRELLQVLINIINNAKDALRECDTNERHIHVTITQDEHELNIAIQDNATGIDEEVLPNIFEPYFTTKENKDGTGLGLYMSKMIIEQHFNGKLYVDTHAQGTCFHISLPAI